MPRYGWFKPIEEMFYDALLFHHLHQEGWYIKPIPPNIDSSIRALKTGEKQGWSFRTHKGKAGFYCSACQHQWTSSHTTVVWRGQWETGRIQIRIEKQGCRECENKCQGRLSDFEIGKTIDWMLEWMWNVFYNPESEEVHEDHDESEDNENQVGPPHDSDRCEAGRKGTCRKCNAMRRREQRNYI